MAWVMGSDEAAFLQAHRRCFLLGLRSDGSPTGWPMIGIYQRGSLEFSTYGRSQKVLDFERNHNACCLVAPEGDDRALLLRGTIAVVTGHVKGTEDSEVVPGVKVDSAISETAQARAASGKRVTLRLTPHEARFIAGLAHDDTVGA